MQKSIGQKMDTISFE